MSVEPLFAALEGRTALAMCAACGRMFTTDANSDRHRKGGGDSYCVDPSTVGLVMDRRGFWSLPGTGRPDLRGLGMRGARGLGYPEALDA
jgi:hypothetical protein